MMKEGVLLQTMMAWWMNEKVCNNLASRNTKRQQVCFWTKLEYLELSSSVFFGQNDGSRPMMLSSPSSFPNTAKRRCASLKLLAFYGFSKVIYCSDSQLTNRFQCIFYWKTLKAQLTLLKYRVTYIIKIYWKTLKAQLTLLKYRVTFIIKCFNWFSILQFGSALSTSQL